MWKLKHFTSCWIKLFNSCFSYSTINCFFPLGHHRISLPVFLETKSNWVDNFKRKVTHLCWSCNFQWCLTSRNLYSIWRTRGHFCHSQLPAILNLTFLLSVILIWDFIYYLTYLLSKITDVRFKMAERWEWKQWRFVTYHCKGNLKIYQMMNINMLRSIWNYRLDVVSRIMA